MTVLRQVTPSDNIDIKIQIFIVTPKGEKSVYVWVHPSTHNFLLSIKITLKKDK